MKSKDLKNVLFGFLVFPFIPMLLTDIIFFKNGIKYFDDYKKTTGVIVKMDLQDAKVRRSRSGSNGATYEKYKTPHIEYEFQWNGKPLKSSGITRFHPEEGVNVEELSSLHFEANSSYKTLKVGAPVVVFVNVDNEYDTFLYNGFDVHFNAVYSWFKFYFLFSLLCVTAFFIIFIVNESKKNLKSD